MIIFNQFNGDNSTIAFVLSEAPPAASSVFVAIDGVTQLVDAYSVNGTTLTFSSPPALGAAIEVRFGSESIQNADFLVGDGSQNSFQLTGTPGADSNALVSIDGVMQRIQAYTISGSNIEFAVAPPIGSEIEVRYGFDSFDGSKTFSGDGGTTSFDLNFTANSKDRIAVVIDGVFQHTYAYDVSGSVLTFVAAPPSGSTIDVRRLKSRTPPFEGVCVLTTFSIPGTGIVVWIGIGYDTGGFWNSGNSTRLTIPIGVNRVRLSAQAVHAGDGSGAGQLSLAITRNGAGGYSGEGRQGIEASNLSIPNALNAQTAAIGVFPGDYFELDLSATSGTWSPSTTWLAMEIIE